MSMCIYRAVDRRTHEVKDWLVHRAQECLYCEKKQKKRTTLVLRRRTALESRGPSRPIGYLHSERGRLLLYTLSLAGTCVHLEWYTMVTVVRRKSLSSPLTWSSLKCLSLLFLLLHQRHKSTGSHDRCSELCPDDGVECYGLSPLTLGLEAFS